MGKWIIIIVIVLVFAALAQWGIGSWERRDFRETLRHLAGKVTADNHEEIRKQVMAAAQKINAKLRPQDVHIAYAPTEELSYPQRVASKIATFENYRATITAEYRQNMLFIPLKYRVEVTSLIQSAAKARQPREAPEP